MNRSSNTLFAVLALIAGLLISVYPDQASAVQAKSQTSPAELEAITMLGADTRALPEFELIDHHSKTLDRSRFKGKWSLMFFGYTSCPDVCPTTLNTISHVVSALHDPRVQDTVKVYFVSVDPGRDKPELLASYMNYFNPDFIAATSDVNNLDILTDALGVSYRIGKKAEGDPSYTVDHSGFVALINPDVEFAGLLFTDPAQVQAVARDLTRLVNGR